MTRVFLDTVGLIAVWDVRDQWHELAERAYEEITRTNATLLCTSYVLAECGNAAARRPYREAPLQLRETLTTWETLVVPDAADWDAAWAAHARGEAGQAGIVDLLAIVVMRRLGITRVFSNDRHFAAAGLQVLF